jgi:CubicO group peptidase (beta-lactamase class C family)
LEFYPGGSRLYSTAGDYLRFLRMLLGGGALDGVRMLRPETVAEMSRNQIGDLPVRALPAATPAMTNTFDLLPGVACKWGLAFLINTVPAATGRTAGSLAWAGINNTYYWIDPMRGVTGLLLAQVSPFLDPAVLRAFARFEEGAYRGL